MSGVPGIPAHYHKEPLIQAQTLLQVPPQEGETCRRVSILAGQGKVAKQAFFW